MVLRKGDKGPRVKDLQIALGVPADGVFGSQTEYHVMQFQSQKGLTADGIVGTKTWEVLGIDTDQNNIEEESEYTTEEGLVIDRHYLDKDQYVRDYGKIEPLGFFLHVDII